MTGSRDVGGYRRAAVAGHPRRLDLNEAPREVDEAFRKRYLEILGSCALRRYPDMDGRTARTHAAALYGWDVKGTLVGNGSNELLAAAMGVLLPRGGKLAVLAPSFSMYPVLARRREAELVEVQLSPPTFAVDSAVLADAARRADVALLCSPNNPTGSEVPAETMEAVLSLGKPVVWDAAYTEFAGVDPVPLLRRWDNLVVLRSLSKAWALAGLRAGTLLASPAMADRVSAGLLPFGTGWAVAAAMQTAAELPAEGAEMVRETVTERRRQLAAAAALPGLEVVDSLANFFLLRRQGLTGSVLFRELLRRGVAVRQVDELAADGWVRVTVGSPAEGDLLLAALEDVGRA